MKIFPWGWEHWLLFWVLLSNVGTFPGLGGALTGAFPGMAIRHFVLIYYDDNQCCKIKEHAATTVVICFKNHWLWHLWGKKIAIFPGNVHTELLQWYNWNSRWKFFGVLIKITLSTARVTRVKTVKTFWNIVISEVLTACYTIISDCQENAKAFSLATLRIELYISTAGSCKRSEAFYLDFANIIKKIRQ